MSSRCDHEQMNRKLAILAPLAVVITLTGCTGPLTPDELNEARPTVSPETPVATSVVGIIWGEKPYMEFNSDGTYGGNAGCNSISGEWEQEGDTVTFGPTGAMTQIGCSGTLDWANFPVTATVTAESITLLDADGAVIDELAAQN